MSLKINKLEIENVKRIKAVKIEPTQNGLTIIGGKNNQGKTSVLDSIAWALGGDRFKPSQAAREGSVIPPTLHIVMNNGLIVERKGKNSALKVTDPNGQKAGQQLLNEFIEQLALDLPKFMEASGKEKAQTLLSIIGVGDTLRQLEDKEKSLYNERLTIGRIADRKEKFAKEQPYYPEAPKELISPSELIRQQQEILARRKAEEEKQKDEEYRKSEFTLLGDSWEETDDAASTADLDALGKYSYFNIRQIVNSMELSEDVLRQGRKLYENGDVEITDVTSGYETYTSQICSHVEAVGRQKGREC